MRPDVIVSWPRNCDYPLWRQFIRDNRDRFARVLVVFTEHDGSDYSRFVTEAMPEAECFRSPRRGIADWRDVAVNAALERSDAEWVWFTEQDFIIDPASSFWERVDLAARSHGTLGYREGTRWHPSCLFVKREAIERTDRYFGPEPIDHFFSFGLQLNPYDLVTEGRLTGFEHLRGLSENHWLLESTGSLDTPGIFERERFVRYLTDCLAVRVPLHPEWRRQALSAVLQAGRT